MMEFEKAINNASTLLLFDQRSQRQLQEWADAAPPNSQDLALIRLTQAAFIYYNAAEAGVDNLGSYIRQAADLLQEVKSHIKNRVIYTMALRMEVDLLMNTSMLTFLGSPPGREHHHLFNQNDARALSICEKLLRNLPTTFDPLPDSWYSSLIPLFPPFQAQTIVYYQDRVKEHRIVALAGILSQVRRELISVAGAVQAKKFIAAHKIFVNPPKALRRLFSLDSRQVLSKVEESLPQHYELASDIKLPQPVTPAELDSAMDTVQQNIDQAKQGRDIRNYTRSLLQLGVLNFLRGNFGRSIQALINTLKVSRNLDPKDKQERANRPEEFPDIPFMIGTNFLRYALEDDGVDLEDRADWLAKSKTGLLHALTLNPHYHQAYVNLTLAVALEGLESVEEVIAIYLTQFGGDLSGINPNLFRNLAKMDSQVDRGTMTPSLVKWMLLAHLTTGGEMAEGQRMLQELKALYILNAHEHSIPYLEQYRSALRQRNETFLEDLKDDKLHSALLFYIAHAYTYLSLQQGRDESDLKVNLNDLNQGIDLNSEALYFNSKNSSALRLVDTQVQLIQFLNRRVEKDWKGLNLRPGRHFQLYEDYLRQEHAYNRLRERLEELNLQELAPEIQISQTARLKMDGMINDEQRQRIRRRIMAT